MMTVAKRNILLYFRDKSALFFSLLAVIILVALYGTFLGNLISDSLPDFPAKKWLLLSWIFAGILAVTSVTTTLGAFGTLVEDRSTEAVLDFYASPIKRSSLFGGYVMSSIFVGLIMCLLVLLTANAVFFFSGDEMLTILQLLKVIGVISLSVISSSSMILLLVSFFKTVKAFAAASTVIGTLLGFLAGIYIPIGNLPAYLQTIIKFFPTSHSAALFRQILMEQPMKETFAQAPVSAKQEFLQDMGVFYEINGSLTSPMFSVLYLTGVAVLFSILAVVLLKRKRS
ncbi:ABC transporter permease [Sporosarcina aquimarina]|uniref:ABC transporter permease n=1 Tax=Sporosarcina aquimarina TaxID=114975 RepID=UPI00203DAFDB|nr:ABC transporter permease [Sporosarcina aquimarina]MCM3757239.1 ABC transporter permease [Sporosarcina aquimarina]